MRMSTNVLVALPDFDPLETLSPEFPVLYLLHGFSHDCFGWAHNTSVIRYACERNMAVVMPSAYNSAYTDMHFGQKYFLHIAEELPEFVRAVLPVSSQREKTFVCGNSMGGYGALKCALTYPERYGAAISLSGSLHAEDRILGRSANSGNQCEGIYGAPPRVDENTQDLFYMLRKRKDEGCLLPHISLYCARDDKEYLYQSSVEFKALADTLGVPATFADGYGGHTFAYWDPLLPQIMDWCLQS